MRSTRRKRKGNSLAALGGDSELDESETNESRFWGVGNGLAEKCEDSRLHRPQVSANFRVSRAPPQAGGRRRLAVVLEIPVRGMPVRTSRARMILTIPLCDDGSELNVCSGVDVVRTSRAMMILTTPLCDDGSELNVCFEVDVM